MLFLAIRVASFPYKDANHFNNNKKKEINPLHINYLYIHRKSNFVFSHFEIKSKPLIKKNIEERVCVRARRRIIIKIKVGS